MEASQGREAQGQGSCGRGGPGDVPYISNEIRQGGSINHIAHLANMMQGGADDEVAEDEKEQCSPIKSKQKTSFAEVTASKPSAKPKAKSAKTSINVNNHMHLRVTTRATPVHP